VFAVSTGGTPVRDPLVAELLAQDALARSIERAVTEARGAGGVPGLADLNPPPGGR
jgi:hypothetical protein